MLLQVRRSKLDLGAHASGPHGIKVGADCRRGTDYMEQILPAPVAGSGADFKGIEMAEKFEIGDHVTWNSEAGRVSGTIKAIHTSDFDYKGHRRHASEADPQYEIKSDKTDHVAAHKTGALTRTK